MRDKEFNFTIDGPGVTPSTVPLRDLFDILKELEAALSATARPHGTGSDDDLRISLTGVAAGSDSLQIAVSEPMYRGAAKVAKALADDDFGSLPVAAHDPLRNLWKKANRTNWVLRFAPNRNGIAAASIRPDHEILTPACLAGFTTLYGKIDRVGSEKKPTAVLVLLSGRRITIHLKDRLLAEQLGKGIFTIVGLEGVARWDSEKWQLDEFKANRLTEYSRVSAVEAFSQLSEVAGNHWDNIDPDEYVRELRSDD